MALRKPWASTIRNGPILQYWAIRPLSKPHSIVKNGPFCQIKASFEKSLFRTVESGGISVCQKPTFELTSV